MKTSAWPRLNIEITPGTPWRYLRGFPYRCTFPKCGVARHSSGIGPAKRCPNFIFKDGNRTKGCGA
jgi:hypothetical protein